MIFSCFALKSRFQRKWTAFASCQHARKPVWSVPRIGTTRSLEANVETFASTVFSRFANALTPASVVASCLASLRSGTQSDHLAICQALASPRRLSIARSRSREFVTPGGPLAASQSASSEPGVGAHSPVARKARKLESSASCVARSSAASGASRLAPALNRWSTARAAFMAAVRPFTPLVVVGSAIAWIGDRLWGLLRGLGECAART